MASRQRARGAKKERAPNPLANLGIFDVPDFEINDDVDDSDVDESVLESELEAILSGKGPSKPSRPKKKVAPPLDIEKMAAECMKDISDDENDEDISDPDLMRELQNLSCCSPDDPTVPEIPSPDEVPEAAPEPTQKPTVNIVTVLEERLNLYNEAIAAAKALNDNSKVRRYGRAVKELQKQLKTAKSGGAVAEEDIPPLVSIPKGSTRPPAEQFLPPATDHSTTPIDNTPTGNLIDILGDSEMPTPPTPGDASERADDCKALMARRDQYKVAAVKAKKAGDKATALKYMKIAKSFDSVIEAIFRGEPVDLSSIPPPPSPIEEITTSIASHPDNKVAHDQTQTSSAIEAAALSAASEPEDPALFAAPPAPASILEALEQRLEKYNSTKAAAEAEGNSGKVRRLQRIIKSYEKAIKDHKMGKPVDYDELPTPPGFAPIPVGGSSQPSAPQEAPAKPNVPAEAVNKPVPPKRTAPPVPSQPAERQKPKVQRTNTSTADRQLEYLLERQRLFRQAAITAKKEGNLQQAKEYLRMSKGFDSMIQATQMGLPIDCSNIPTPPQLESNDFVVVDISDCVDEDCSSSELLETLEKDLVQQIEVCNRNSGHFLQIGDVSSASKFEKLGLESKKDLCVIRHLQKTGQSPPKFHYETRVFSMVIYHPDLTDHDFEITSLRGINLPGKPNEPLGSYVKVELPIPSEAPQTGRTLTVKDTNNPEYAEKFRFQINRKSRAQLRQFKRHALKLEVWSKGRSCLCFSGFLRSDTLIGTVNVKLVDLESKCLIHDAFDLMDGRKACGGRLEVKIRIRQPLLVKQVEEVREKWLVIGS